MTLLEKAQQLVARADRVAVLTGAGVSAESGVPTFRGAGGYWRNFSPSELATADAFARNPELVWEWYMSRRSDIAAVQPNAGHRSLAEMERRHPTFTLITQNVDGLHSRAGSRNILKIHGDIWLSRCTGCSYQRMDRTTEYTGVPRCPECEGLLRPGVVWFGETLPELVWNDAERAVHDCQLLIVAGTSAQVYPAAGLIAQCPAPTIEVNLEETPYSTAVTVALRGKCAEILPQLL